jgi:hypothetical protein
MTIHRAVRALCLCGVLLGMAGLAGCGFGGLGGSSRPSGSPTATAMPTATSTSVAHPGGPDGSQGTPPAGGPIGVPMVGQVAMSIQGAGRSTLPGPVQGSSVLFVEVDLLLVNPTAADATYNVGGFTLWPCGPGSGTCGVPYEATPPNRFIPLGWELGPGQSPERGTLLPGKSAVVPLVYVLSWTAPIEYPTPSGPVPPDGSTWTLDSGAVDSSGQAIQWTITA